MSGPFQSTMRLPAAAQPCSSCRKAMPADSKFCPACGKAVESSSVRRLDPAAAAEPLLAQANLLRARQDFDEAEKLCIDALRLDPNNLHAHSLLGDLYREQKRLDDAGQWYQLALDLDPGSSVIRGKLREVEELQARKLVRSVHSGAHSVIPSGTQRLAGLAPTMWIRGLWAAFAFFLIAAGILIANRRNSRPISSGARPGYGSMSGGTYANRSPGKFVLPPQRPNTSQMARVPPAPPPNLGTKPPGQMDAGAVQMPGSAGTSLSASSADSVVASMTVDPSQQRAEVVLAQRSAEPEPAESLRRRTLHNAYRAAHAMFAANASFQQIGIAVRAGSDGPALFSGEISRESVNRMVDMGDSSQILSAFSQVWWNPELIQDSAAASPDGTPSAPSSDSPP